MPQSKPKPFIKRDTAVIVLVDLCEESGPNGLPGGLVGALGLVPPLESKLSE